MKHGKLSKLLALALVLCLSLSLVTPASAAGRRTAGTSGYSLGSIWDWLRGKLQPTQPEEEPELKLVEDESTVTDGTALRASTYTLGDTGISPQATKTILKYFPVTMYDYDTTTINNATHQVEVDNGLSNTWNGIYFSKGSPAAESYTYSNEGGYTYSPTTVAYRDRNDSTYTNGSYYVDVNGTKYVVTNITCNRSGNAVFGYTYKWTISYTGGSTTSSASSITLYTRKASNTTTTSSLPYAAWNWWNKNTGNNDYGQYTYSGLVNSTLDANKNISFTKPDGGIFNSDTTVKTIYTNVDMPFVYSNGTYTFDASQNGVYFSENSSQSSTKAQSNGRLYFNEGNPQSNGGGYGDGSKTVWMPFNSTQSISGESNCNYHFGMAATIPFTMTANGKMNANDNNSEDITFSFSGDDDVWVFIDGKLVLDIGGIHNRLDATINFAQNTWSLSKSNTVNVAVADYNGAAISGTVFNEGSKTGKLNQTRETFAATTSHELTIFYLERGAGSSNCKIQFNLPIYDVVSVQKIVDGQAYVEDGVVKTKGLDDLTSDQLAVLNNQEFGFTLYKDGQPVANRIYNRLNVNGQVVATPSTDANGHFVLKNGETAKFIGAFTDSGNNYYVVEDIKDGFIYSTYDATCRAAGGGTENQDTGSATHTYYKQTNDQVYYVTDMDYSKGKLQSYTYNVKGSNEAEDSLQFVCKNYMNASLPRPSAIPQDEQVVIDYGLPVEIDIRSNDLWLGDSATVTFPENNVGENGKYDGQYGEFTYNAETGKITYQLTEQLTGVEVIEYTLTSTAANGNETVTATGTAKVYIIPATSMYYEENFSGLVTFKEADGYATWVDYGTAEADVQEPGVVGTVGDSPYGSDVAYLNDGLDSNNSSKYVKTENGPASFSYSFSGTGTSFFARTTNNSAYMAVVIKDESGNTVKQYYRDTSYKTTDDTTTLYNIPVFTWEATRYGTYTVTVTLAVKNETFKYGGEFWLDGIRVMNPLNEEDQNAAIAESAYATDGEANMTFATLREKLLADYTTDDQGNITWLGEGFVIFTDSNGQIKKASEYKSNGPKEEVYLNEGQSVTFSLSGWDANSNKIYLGIKAPTGAGSVSINGHSVNINNAADCYYDISEYATITGEGNAKIATFKVEATSNLISVTNIKVTGNVEFTIVLNNNVDIDGSES